MSEAGSGTPADRHLERLGADLARWPDASRPQAREALLRDAAFRRAWEAERVVDDGLRAHRDELDRMLVEAGALTRLRARTLAQVPGPLAGLGWQRVAAAVVVAAMLGGALDLYWGDAVPQTQDIVLLDPLDDSSASDVQ